MDQSLVVVLYAGEVVQPMTSLLIALMLSTPLASQVPFPPGAHRASPRSPPILLPVFCVRGGRRDVMWRPPFHRPGWRRPGKKVRIPADEPPLEDLFGALSPWPRPPYGWPA